MTSRVIIVTGGLRGLGKAMTVGLVENGHRVLAAGHLREDVAEFWTDPRIERASDRVEIMHADIRSPEVCDQVVERARQRFGRLDGLINNAGLTFTYISPNGGIGPGPRFWEIKDEIVQNVINTNFVAANQMARRVAAHLIPQGWGRIINVTTKLETMNRPGTTPYGPSKAALEMASEVWAKEADGTGVTVNILNPGAGAHTDGISPELRQKSREGKITRFIEPEEMVPPLLWLVSEDANHINGMRFDANTWNRDLPAAEAAKRNGRPSGFQMKAIA
jgi:NAD(P)-dependent dehydrogenase (short-subunit alcohol dehydrogenase family)